MPALGTGLSLCAVPCCSLANFGSDSTRHPFFLISLNRASLVCEPVCAWSGVLASSALRS